MTWLVENGIGESRAILLQNDQVAAARLQWSGPLIAGQVEDAVLIARSSGSPRGTARFANGQEALVDRLPRDAQQGAPIRLVVTREALGEQNRLKRAQARPTDLPLRPAPSLAESLQADGSDVRVVRQFPAGHWEDIWAEARSGIIDFAGGSLHFSDTPAMVLIDVDGTLPPRDLALAAVRPVADAIFRFDLAGSIGIDFPTLQTKADRRAVDETLAAALDGWAHESTAMNGFGFVQLVSRLERPSILHRLSQSPADAAARMLLRRAGQVGDPGALQLTCHPAVEARLHHQWIEELKRQTGREVRIIADAGLALDAAFAQAVAL